MKTNFTLPLKALFALLLTALVFNQRLGAAAPLSATLSVSNTACNGDYSGAIRVFATGGIQPYLYSYYMVNNYSTPFITADTLVYISAGNYVVTVTDAANHSVIIPATISSPPLLVLTDSVVTATSGNNGALYCHVSGGVPPYTYGWNTGDTTTFITGLSPTNNYSTVVTDAHGCQTSIYNVQVDTGSSALRGFVGFVNVTGCFPTQSMSFSFQARGGVLPYTFSLDGSDYRSGFTMSTNYYDVSGNAHIMRVKDARGVVFTLPYTFPQMASSALTVNAVITPASDGISNGSISLTASGGVAPYTYCCQLTDLAPGNYGYRVTDHDGCQAGNAVFIQDSTQIIPFAIFDSVLNYSCTNADNYRNGALYLNVTGGHGLARYSIDDETYIAGMNYQNGSFAATLNLSAGNHILHISNSDTLVNLHVFIPGDSVSARINSVNATGGLSNGSANVITVNGFAPFTYNWSDNETTDTASGIAPVTQLSVYVQDSLGCGLTLYATIDSGAFTGSIFTQQPVSCSPLGYAVLTLSGGTQPYHDGNGNVVSSGQEFDFLSPGIHHFTISDANNTVIVLTDTVNIAPLPLTLSYTSTQTHQYLNFGTVTLTASGGTPPYSYRFNGTTNNTGHFTGLGASQYYSGQATDANGCSINLYSIIVGDSTGDALIGSVNVSNNNVCDSTNGYIEVQVTGGTTPYIYHVGNQTDTTSNTYMAYYNYAPGVYTATVTDAMGLVFQSHFTIYRTPVNTPITLTATITNATGGLQNGAIATHVSGGVAPYTYSWNPFAAGSNPTGLVPQQYSVQVRDSLGCSQQLYVTVDTGNSALHITTTVNNSLCTGSGEIYVNSITGGTIPYSYALDSSVYEANGGDYTNLNAGIYAVHVKDGVGTIVTVYDTITAQPDHLAVTGTVVNATSANNANGAIALHINNSQGYYSIGWQDETTLIKDSFLLPGVYSPVITDSLGCSVHPVFTVGVGVVTFQATMNITNVACYGENTGSITVNATSPNQPITYEIENSGFTTNNYFDLLTAGFYHITVTDGSGSTIHLTATITQPEAPLTLNAYNTNANSSLNNATINVSISGGTAPYTTLWSDVFGTNDSRGGLGTGEYITTIRDAAGCTVNDIFNIDTTILARLVAITNLHCFGDSTGTIILSASGSTAPYTFKLNNGAYQADSAFTNLGAGVYTIVVRSATNDTFTVQQVVTQPTAIVVNGTVTNTSSGQSNGAINVTVSGGAAPYSYNWGGGVTTANRTGLSAGTYNLTVTDSSGCSATQTYSIVGVGINTVLANAGIQLYPNPSVGAVTLSMQNATGFVNVNVYNTIGQLVITKNIEANGSLETPLQMQSLPDGIYEVKITNNNVTSVARVVIAK